MANLITPLAETPAHAEPINPNTAIHTQTTSPLHKLPHRQAAGIKVVQACIET